MGVDILIGGKPRWDASAYSVTEDSTPIDPSDSSGGVGQFTFTVPENDDSKKSRGETVVLDDGSQGTTSGKITSASGNGTDATLTADSRLAALMVTRTAQPFSGTLQAAFEYYLGLIGIDNGIVVDASIASRAVVFPGWGGVVWDYMKKMATAQRIEISLVSNNIVLRVLRGRVAENRRNSVVAWSLDASSLAQSIEVYYYNNSQLTNGLAYPIGGWTDNVTTYSVDAGETKTFDIPLIPGDVGAGASLTSIQQPTCVSFVDSGYVASSVYAVMGNDGLIIPPGQWTAGGGSVSVTINPDTTSITLSITGSSETQYAPYRLAMPSGTSDYYSSLRLVGTGVFFDKQMMTLYTGLDADAAPTVIGATVDNPFISQYWEALDAGLWAVGNYSTARQKLTVTTTGINRAGDTGSYKYSTFGDANIEYAGKTMGQVNAIWPGATMGQVSAFWKAKTQGDFANQAFGNVAGARTLDNGMWYRIRSVQPLSPANLSYTAERDIIASDLNTRYAGLTMGQVNALWPSATMGDFNVAPVKE